MRIMPRARKLEKVIPIAVSLLIMELLLIKVIIVEAKSPKMMAPMKKLIPKIKEMATPGRTACEIASPISDIPLRIIKQPTAPPTIPITKAVIRAFCKKWKFSKPSINSEIIYISFIK